MVTILVFYFSLLVGHSSQFFLLCPGSKFNLLVNFCNNVRSTQFIKFSFKISLQIVNISCFFNLLSVLIHIYKSLNISVDVNVIDYLNKDVLIIY